MVCTFVGGDQLSRIELSVLDRRVGMLVAGPPRSGRSTVAVSLASEALQRGARVMVAADSSRASYEPLVDQGLTVLTEEQLATSRELPLNADEPTLIVLDDADRTLRTALSAAMPELLRGHPRLRALVVGAADELMNDVRGLVTSIKRDQVGVLLMPQLPLEGQLFGLRIDRALLGGKVGRGVLCQEGMAQRVQVVT